MKRNELITVAQAAELRSKSKQWVYNLMRAGTLKKVGVGFPVLLRKSDVLKVELGRKKGKNLLSVQDLAQHFGVGAPAVRHHIRTGTLKPFRKISGSWFFSRTQIKNLHLPRVGRPALS